MISSEEFLPEIFKNFADLQNNQVENILWKINSIMTLIKVSGKVDDKKIEEGLGLILNLGRIKEGGDLLESFEKETFPISDLSDSEKESFNSILQGEFT